MPTGPESGQLVLDTTAYSRFRAGHPQVLDAIAAADVVVVPAVVIGELEAGFELGSQAAENRATLAEFLAEPFVETRDVTPSVARTYGRIFAALRRAGTPIPLNDIWIAATTIDRGGRLLTFDRHFERVDGLSSTLLQA